MPETELSRLVADCVRGDTAGRRQLWDEQAPAVRRLLSRLLGPSYDVDDALQETFLRVFRDLPTLREPDALPAFIRTIAVNVARKQLRWRRQQRLWGLLPTRDAPPDTAAPDRDPQATVAVRRLYDVLESLPTKQRTVFVLRFIEGLQLDEVAHATGVSLATAKRWLATASDKVRARGRNDALLAEYFDRSKEGETP